MLDYIWSIGDEGSGNGRSLPPKPECPSGSASYVFARVAPSPRRPELKDGAEVKDEGWGGLSSRWSLGESEKVQNECLAAGLTTWNFRRALLHPQDQG